MSAIGSLIFCTDCGNLLQESTGSPDAILVCEVCGAKNRDILPQTIISESKPNAFPSALRAKRSAVQTLTAEDRTVEAVTQKTCDKCGRKEMFFTTAQLRSADEGTTVFYRCVCGFKETVNN
ncbi:putative DNA-directed RNA polymerase I 13.1 kDa polypeptide [Talaromyces proteolyticus]|uniref:DNA-directed RNA polymerase subunit n=1 Tax=Talaromyces proteolyticus TaxID=1131652 RepID=A0AAD4KU41_9EURO|nr:putative DNA-directed RNA polymerase I 13.1 kDa polypeptide [Talaromyces proteolyticus]KAH8696104.1 putative DNA-directed RNA polymerase I 13.1 kDa polypeptide [Talaromyces proteolyticus]